MAYACVRRITGAGAAGMFFQAGFVAVLALTRTDRLRAYIVLLRLRRPHYGSCILHHLQTTKLISFIIDSKTSWYVDHFIT